jgi:hypothetical protein
MRDDVGAGTVFQSGHGRWHPLDRWSPCLSHIHARPILICLLRQPRTLPGPWWRTQEILRLLTWMRAYNGTGILVHHGNGELGPFDQVVAATGFRPDLAPLRELRLSLDPAVEAPTAIASLIDPNDHSCGSVPPHGALELAHPESDFYIAGLKSYGRAPTFLMLSGYEQVRSIAAALAGDLDAAARVDRVLPETGVREVNLKAPDGAGDVACCGGDAPTVEGAPAAVSTKTLPVVSIGGCCTTAGSAATGASCCG